MVLAQVISPPIPNTPSSEQAAFFYLYICCGAFLLAVVLGIVTLIVMLRRKPPIEAEFATKAEMNEAMHTMKQEMHREVSGLKEMIDSLDRRNDQRSTAIFDKIDDIAKSFDTGMREVHRAIGRLEGPEKK